MSDIKTYFAHPERSSKETIKDQVSQLKNNILLADTLNSMSNICLIINDKRQIVFANKHTCNSFNKNNYNEMMGLRPGELLGCIHSQELEGGCGTTKSCRYCGAVNGILESQNKKISRTKECNIEIEGNKTLNLKTWATPYSFNEYEYTIYGVFTATSPITSYTIYIDKIIANPSYL
ncbi:MAG: hypothetical protein GY756_25975 [bacterium]|nr:hypothetical protein [bacterium]